MDAVTEFLTYDGKTKLAASPFDAARVVAGQASAEAAARESVQAGKTFGKRFRDAAESTGLALAVAGAFGAGIGAAEAVTSKAMNAISRSRGFHRMVKANPQLQSMDQTKLQSYYKTLHTFNPEMAADPFVAASWVKQISEFDHVPVDVITHLVGARDKKQIGMLAKMTPFVQTGMQEARERDRTIREIAARAYELGDVDYGEHKAREAKALAYAQSVGKRVSDEETAKVMAEFARLNVSSPEYVRSWYQTIGAAHAAPDPKALTYHQTIARVRAERDADDMRDAGTPVAPPGGIGPFGKP